MAVRLWQSFTSITDYVLSEKNVFKNFVFSCFVVKQKFYGHLLVTRIFHLVTRKKISVATWCLNKKIISDPTLMEGLYYYKLDYS